MIRIAVLMDEARVVGSSDAVEDRRRLDQLPSSVSPIVGSLYSSAHVVVGAGSEGPFLAAPHVTDLYILTGDADYAVTGEVVGTVHRVDDPMVLVNRFADHDRELLVAGGRDVFTVFTPHADRIDIAMTSELVPGDLIYDAWEDGSFAVEGQDEWVGGRTIHLVSRRVRRLHHARRLYLEGIRDGHPRAAMAAHTGDRYTQHSTGVPDGKDGFVAFFDDFLARNPDRDIQVQRGFADGPLVFVLVTQVLNGGEAAWLTADIFDTDADDRLIEHWDVIQALTDPRQTGTPAPLADLDRTEANKATVADLMAARQDVDTVHVLLGRGNQVVALSQQHHAGVAEAVVDIYRLADGAVTEHISVAEPVPPAQDLTNSGKF